VQDPLRPIGDLTGLPAFEDLIPPWHAEASCAGEQDEMLFFSEASGATVRPHLEDADLLLAGLICSGCPVRVDCLRSSLVPITIPGVVRETPSGRGMMSRPEHLRVMGVWGGSSEYDRTQLKHLPVEERVEELELTLGERIRQRTEAWYAAVVARSPQPGSKKRVIQKRDRRVAALLQIDPEELKTAGIRTSKRFMAGGRGGPGRGHRSKIGRYAAAEGVSYATAWRRLRLGRSPKHSPTPSASRDNQR